MGSVIGAEREFQDKAAVVPYHHSAHHRVSAVHHVLHDLGRGFHVHPEASNKHRLSGCRGDHQRLEGWIDKICGARSYKIINASGNIWRLDEIETELKTYSLRTLEHHRIVSDDMIVGR